MTLTLRLKPLRLSWWIFPINCAASQQPKPDAAGRADRGRAYPQNTMETGIPQGLFNQLQRRMPARALRGFRLLRSLFRPIIRQHRIA
jgi:hypothetical protein